MCEWGGIVLPQSSQKGERFGKYLTVIVFHHFTLVKRPPDASLPAPASLTQV